MSTRALTIFKDAERCYAAVYRHDSGYINDGHGHELAQFLRGYTVTNGVRNGAGPTANGAGCLAAQMVKVFKTGPGGLYLQDSQSPALADYTYVVTAEPNRAIDIKVLSYGALVFQGTPEELAQFVESEED